MSEIDKLHARIRQLENEIASVRSEAVEAVGFWGQFASKYSQAHHDLQGDIARLKGRSAIAASPSETPLRLRRDLDGGEERKRPVEASPTGRLSTASIADVTRE